jgi:hypothetical protein
LRGARAEQVRDRSSWIRRTWICARTAALEKGGGSFAAVAGDAAATSAAASALAIVTAEA